jgi:hypothetical protein
MANKSKMTHQGEKTSMNVDSFGEKYKNQKFIFTARSVKMDCPFTNTIN